MSVPSEHISSSLFSFVKVAQPADTFGSPSFVVSVRTKNGQNIEPIDSLQTLFSLVHECSGVGMDEINDFGSHFKLYPNPATEELRIENNSSGKDLHLATIYDITGSILSENYYQQILKFDIRDFPKGIYFVRVSSGGKTYTSKFIKE